MAYLPNHLEISVEFLKHTNIINKSLLMEYETDLNYTLKIRDTIAIMAVLCTVDLIIFQFKYGELINIGILDFMPSYILLFIRYRIKRRKIRGLIIASVFFFLYQYVAISTIENSYLFFGSQKVFLIILHLALNLFMIVRLLKIAFHTYRIKETRTKIINILNKEYYKNKERFS